MSGIFWLDWAALSLSIFVTMLLLWLGLTVLLNAEHRSAGVWLACVGLLLGSAFFISHSAILAQSATPNNPGLNFWWNAGWIPVILAPFVWYAVVLWYTGYWDDPHAALHRRQRIWFWPLAALTLLMVGALLFANPLPSFAQVAYLDLSAVPLVGGLPVFILSYPLYIGVCILLALDALLRPGPTARMMGDLARRRARPWLLGATFTLLAVSLLVGGVLFWLVSNAAQMRSSYDVFLNMAARLAGVDFVIAALIALAVLMLGQAIVSYEVFTGKVLPRQGLRRHWRNAILLSAGVSLVVGGALTVRLRSVYGLLLVALLFTVFYALLSWRSYAERENTIHQLRPFVASQRLYEQLLVHNPAEVDTMEPFAALCAEVLGVQSAALLPLGSLAPLVPPLRYPADGALPLLSQVDLAARFDSPEGMIYPLEPEQSAEMRWAVPLWSERGLIGVLLLADKSDGGFYTQEEIEVARASCERLVDTQATAEIARRLMTLQRQRMAESQVVDRRTRRVLHDSVLPELHAALLTLSAQPQQTEEGRQALQHLAGVHRQIADLLRELPAGAPPDVARYGLLGALRRLTDEEMRAAFDQVHWEVQPLAGEAAGRLSSLAAEVLFYAAYEAMRNAALHARPSGDARPLHLWVRAEYRQGLVIEIEDDGVGVEAAQPRAAGAGQGLALHSTLMAVVGGVLELESTPGRFTRVRLSLRE